MLMTNKWPSWYSGDPSADHNVILGQILNDSASFNTGLGISYSHNILNQPSAADTTREISPGHRAPDTQLNTPCTYQPIRLFRVTRNVDRFSIVIFAGSAEPAVFKSLKKLSNYLIAHPSLASHEAISWITVPALVGNSTYETLGMDPFGDTYYDPSGSTHARYAIKQETGGVVVIRPDGLIAFRCAIDGGQIGQYFSKFLLNV